eukprot:10775912-Alexandrium_andersonii.AAC.1
MIQSSSSEAVSSCAWSWARRGLEPGCRGQPSGLASTHPWPARTLNMTKSSLVDWYPPVAELSWRSSTTSG